MFQSFLYRYEKLFFLVLVAIHLIPVCCTRFFPTLDGPAHLYNSNLINCMLFEPGVLANHYFYFNFQPLPNVSGHVLLCLLNSFLPSYLAEKFLLIIYIMALPVCFRLLVNQLNPGNVLMSYLIFPFIYSYFFYKGFFNFCLSLPVFFYTLSFWLKHQDHLRIKKGIILFFLFTILYFSHLMSFLLALGSIVFLILWKTVFVTFRRNDKIKKKTENILIVKQVARIFLIAAPAIILTIGYLKNNLQEHDSVFLTRGELFFLLTKVKPLLTLGYVNLLPYLFLVLMLLAILKKWQGKKENSFIIYEDRWFVLMFLTLLLLFIIPDQTATGGFVSIRISLYVYLICLVWISTQATGKFVVCISVLMALFVSLHLLRFYTKEAKELNRMALEYEQASYFITENSIVLPLNYSEHLISSNMLTYIGSEKRILILDNYEALTTHFPLKWKAAYLPDGRSGNYLSSNRPWVNIPAIEKQLNRKIDYVVKGCYSDTIKDSSTTFVNKQLEVGYDLILKKEYVRVYRRR